MYNHMHSFQHYVIIFIVILQHNVQFTTEFENTTQIVTTRLTVTERSGAVPFSSKLSDTEGTDEKENDGKICSATLCSALCPESYFKCDITETACVCANSKNASEPHSSCKEIVSSNSENITKFADVSDLAACSATCRRIAQQVSYYGYRIHLYICEPVSLTATSESKNGQCVCYFFNASIYYGE